MGAVELAQGDGDRFEISPLPTPWQGGESLSYVNVKGLYNTTYIRIYSARVLRLVMEVVSLP